MVTQVATDGAANSQPQRAGISQKKIGQKPHVILLYPKTGFDYGSTVAPPHSLLTIAAPLLKSGYSVKVLDQRTEPIDREILRDLVSSDLICVGISTMTGTQIRNALNLAQMVREITDVPIVWGGPHPSVTAVQTVAHPNVDIVVVGEGDETLSELVVALEHSRPLAEIKGLVYKNGPDIIQTLPRPLMNVENLLETPWELIDVEKYVYRDMYVRNRFRTLDLGQTSRGCPFDCGFCSSASIRERKWRAMSPEKSLAMITDGIKRFRLDGFWLRDDEFYIQRKRAHAIFEGMVQAGLDVSFYTSGTRADVLMKATREEIALMKRAGSHTLKIGAESGSQRILDLMQKGLKIETTLAANLRCAEFGIAPVYSLMIGYPTETFAEMNQTIDLAFKLRRENPRAQTETMAQYTALPGTPDFNLALKHGLQPPNTLEGWADWLFDDYDLTGCRSPWYTAQEREWMGNITYMSILSNALENVAGTQDAGVIRNCKLTGARVVGRVYRYRLSRKQYRAAPELRAVRFLRRKLFYEGAGNPFKFWTKYSHA